MSFSTNIKIPTWLIIVQGVELFLLFVFLFFSTIASAAIVQNRLFHSNLRFLTYVMGLSWFLLTGFRIASIIDQFLYTDDIASDYILLLEWPHIIFEAGRTFSVAFGLSGAIMMIFERIVASLLLDTYQHKKHTCLVSFGLAIIMPFTSLMAYYTLTVQFGYVVALIGGTIGCIVFTTFLLLDRWNHRRLHLATKHGFNYTLKQRFQLTENIRAAKIIYKTVMSCSVGSIIVVALFVSYRFTQTPEHIFILRAIFNMYASCFTFSMVILTVTRTHTWRQAFIQKLQKIRLVLCSRRLRIVPEKKTPLEVITVINTEGRVLSFEQQKEGEIYFKQLEAAWI